MDTDGDRDGLSLTELARRADVTPRTVRYYIAQGLIPSPPAGPGQHYGQSQLQRIALIKRLQREHLPLAEIRGRLSALDDASVAQALAEAEMGDHEIAAAQALDAATSPDRERALTYIRRVLDEGATRRAGPSRTLMAPASASSSVAPPTASDPLPPQPASSAPSSASTGITGPAPMHLAEASAPAPAGRSLSRRLSSTPPTARYEPNVPDEYPLRDDPARTPPTMPSPAMPYPGMSPRPSPSERSTWERIPLAADLELHVRRPLDRETNRRLDRLLAFARELFEGT
jgi:DNA-binding transcriptional MerR regulator